MDTNDIAETIAPSVAPAKLTPKPKPAGESQREDPIPSVPLSGLVNNSLGSLGAAPCELHVQTPEGKAKEKDTGERGAKQEHEGEHVRTDDVSSGERPSESARGATKHPTASSSMSTTLPATHQSTSCPTHGHMWGHPPTWDTWTGWPRQCLPKHMRERLKRHLT